MVVKNRVPTGTSKVEHAARNFSRSGLTNAPRDKCWLGADSKEGNPSELTPPYRFSHFKPLSK